MTDYEAQVRKVLGGWEWRVTRDGQTVERQVYDGFGPRRCHGLTMTRWGARRYALRTIHVLRRESMPVKRGKWEKV